MKESGTPLRQFREPWGFASAVLILPGKEVIEMDDGLADLLRQISVFLQRPDFEVRVRTTHPIRFRFTFKEIDR
jgi:hypothetical protein